MKTYCQRFFATVAVVIAFATVSPCAERPSNNPNDYRGADSDRIEAALAASDHWGGIARIPPRVPDEEGDRDYWLLDRAVLLRDHTTLILEGCVLKLSDACRDNFIRSANCGASIEKVEPTTDIRIIGLGAAELRGADHPRATGDSGKTLGVRTYGADAGKEGESQTGDWRNIGVLLANARNFQIENLTIRQAHGWSVSLEKCENGTIRNLRFESDETRVIDGKTVAVLNADGIDLRKGCRNISIDGAFGRTGDDLVAVTAINPRNKVGGTFDSTEVCDYSPDEDLDVCDISIRNVIGYASGGHQIVRILNASGIKISNVVIDGVIDASPEGVVDRATIRIGDSNPAWGGVAPLGDTRGIIATNIQSRAREAVLIAGSLADSIVSNVVNYNPDCEGVSFASGEENARGVVVSNWINAYDKK